MGRLSKREREVLGLPPADRLDARLPRPSAVWRPSTDGERQVYDWALEDLRNEYDKMW